MSDHEKTAHGFEDSDPDWFSTVVVGAVGILLLYGVIIAVEALYAQASRNEFERKVVEEAPLELHSVQAAQLEQISKYRMVDPKTGLVTIPIERAMELLVEESKAATEGRTRR